jgi:hypothetical protein
MTEISSRLINSTLTTRYLGRTVVIEWDQVIIENTLPENNGPMIDPI